jgi:hypothetical protein
LGEGLKATGESIEPARLDFRSIWGGRSGCRIGVIGHHADQSHGDKPDQTVVFKHGPASKMTLESANLALWEESKPGLTPKVKAFIPAEAGNEAALIMEFVPSRNIQALFLDSAHEAARNGVSEAIKTMVAIWRETKNEAKAKSDFCRQTEDRLSEAEVLYPQLIRYSGAVGDWKIRPVKDLLSEAKELEEELSVPFVVRIHGDFNLSNLLYNPETNRITFVDLYRSSMSDYVQDASVMLVSIIRLPVANYRTRIILGQIARQAEAVVRRFAESEGDDTYMARLAFGLSRSFVTSTRVVLDSSLAKQFVNRARYLWDSLISHRRRGLPWSEFSVNLNILDVILD